MYAATAGEKQEWMAHIDACIRDLLQKGGKKAASDHAAVWVPDSEANNCMVCKRVSFNVINRRVSTNKTKNWTLVQNVALSKHIRVLS